MGEVKLTKAQRGGLEWFAAQPTPVALFDRSAPSKVVIKRLVAADLVERTVPVAFGFINYGITTAGRAALAKAKGGAK